jgi:hypothetical protein
MHSPNSAASLRSFIGYLPFDGERISKKKERFQKCLNYVKMGNFPWAGPVWLLTVQRVRYLSIHLP